MIFNSSIPEQLYVYDDCDDCCEDDSYCFDCNDDFDCTDACCYGETFFDHHGCCDCDQDPSVCYERGYCIYEKEK